MANHKDVSQSQPGTRKLDRTDRRILELLQLDGRISNVKLAELIHLSPTPCLERVKRLEKEGFIKNYVAILDPKMLDAALVSFIEVSFFENESYDLILEVSK